MVHTLGERGTMGFPFRCVPSESPSMSADWKTVCVFISSTFRDMQAERDRLAEKLHMRSAANVCMLLGGAASEEKAGAVKGVGAVASVEGGLILD